MRQIDDLTNNSSIWYEYEEQKPVIIEGYQKRDTIKVSYSYIYKVENNISKEYNFQNHMQYLRSKTKTTVPTNLSGSTYFFQTK